MKFGLSYKAGGGEKCRKSFLFGKMTGALAGGGRPLSFPPVSTIIEQTCRGGRRPERKDWTITMKLGIGVHTLDSISPYLSINAAKA